MKKKRKGFSWSGRHHLIIKGFLCHTITLVSRSWCLITGVLLVVMYLGKSFNGVSGGFGWLVGQVRSFAFAFLLLLFLFVQLYILA